MLERQQSRSERRNERKFTNRFAPYVAWLYLPLSFLPNLNTWLQGPTHTLTGGTGGDTGHEVWFLGVVAHQLRHFHSPFFTDVANVPRGINLTNVTSMPFLGTLAAPLTWIWGPVFSYNFLTVVSTVVSALAMYWAAGRFASNRSARFAAGLLYGFSPFMAAQLWGHLFLSSIYVFPAMIVAIHEIFVRQVWSPRISGGLLTLCLIVQIGISPELLLDALICAIVPIIIVAASLVRRPRAASAYVGKCLATAAGFAAFPLGLFLYEFLYGKGHMVGAYRSASTVDHLKMDIVSFVFPSSIQKFGFGISQTIDSYTYLMNPSFVPDMFETGGYIGIPLLIFLAVVAPRIWRRREVWILSLGGLVALLLSLGKEPSMAGHALGVQGPFTLFQSLPLLESSIASRWTLFMWLFLAIVVAIGIDRALATVKSSVDSRMRTARFSGLIALAVAVVLALLPNWPMSNEEQQVPKWFQSAHASQLTLNDVVLTSPLPQNGAPLAMMWQAVSGFNFRLAYGSAGPQTSEATPAKLLVAQCDTPKAPTIPDLTLLSQAQQELRGMGVTKLISTTYSSNPTCARIVFSALAGTPGIDQDDVRVWNFAQ